MAPPSGETSSLYALAPGEAFHFRSISDADAVVAVSAGDDGMVSVCAAVLNALVPDPFTAAIS